MPVFPGYAVPGPESVSDLVKRIADRDRAAFGRLYRRLVRAVFIQVCADVGSPSIAVAVTRAVFVEVWQLAPRCAGQVDGLAWVTAIAVRRARPGDLVLVAGKGHETTQTTAGVAEAFDDRVVAREEILAELSALEASR